MREVDSCSNFPGRPIALNSEVLCYSYLDERRFTVDDKPIELVQSFQDFGHIVPRYKLHIARSSRISLLEHYARPVLIYSLYRTV